MTGFQWISGKVYFEETGSEFGPWSGLRRYIFFISVLDPDSLSPDPDPKFLAEYRSGSGVFMTKNVKSLQLKNVLLYYFFDQKSKHCFSLSEKTYGLS
jgi:hypothetical protein